MSYSPEAGAYEAEGTSTVRPRGFKRASVQSTSTSEAPTTLSSPPSSHSGSGGRASAGKRQGSASSITRNASAAINAIAVSVDEGTGTLGRRNRGGAFSPTLSPSSSNGAINVLARSPIGSPVSPGGANGSPFAAAGVASPASPGSLGPSAYARHGSYSKSSKGRRASITNPPTLSASSSMASLAESIPRGKSADVPGIRPKTAPSEESPAAEKKSGFTNYAFDSAQPRMDPALSRPSAASPGLATASAPSHPFLQHVTAAPVPVREHSNLLQAEEMEDESESGHGSSNFLQEYGLLIENPNKEKSGLLRKAFSRKGSNSVSPSPGTPTGEGRGLGVFIGPNETRHRRRGSGISPGAPASPPISPGAAATRNRRSASNVSTSFSAAPYIASPRHAGRNSTTSEDTGSSASRRESDESRSYTASSVDSHATSRGGKGWAATLPAHLADLPTEDENSDDDSNSSSYIATPLASLPTTAGEERSRREALMQARGATPATNFSGDSWEDDGSGSLVGSDDGAEAKLADLDIDAPPVLKVTTSRPAGDARGVVADSDAASLLSVRRDSSKAWREDEEANLTDREDSASFDDELKLNAPILSAAVSSPTTPVPREVTHEIPPTLPLRFTPPAAEAAPAPPAEDKRSDKEKKADEKEQAKADKLKAKEEARAAKDAEVRAESRKRREARESKVLMQSWEELEVERFMSNFGKHVHEVRSAGLLDPSTHNLELPTLEEWRQGGSVNWIGYIAATTGALLGYLTPARFADVQAGTDAQSLSTEAHDFRVVALKANGERIYMTAVPLYEGLWARMRRLWRWESKLITAASSVAYTMAWYRGLLLPGFFALMIVYVLKLRLFPPKPETLSRMIARQQRRAQELEQARSTDSAKVLEAAERKAEPSASGEAAELVKQSRYGLAADATRRYGLNATHAAGFVADLHERVKNFALFRSPAASWRTLVLLSICMIFTLGATPWILARLPGLVLGALFFAIAPIVEHRPDWLAAEWSNPLDFLLAGVPNDSQFAMEILRRRAAAGQPLLGDRDLQLALEGESDAEEEPLGTDGEMDTDVEAPEEPAGASTAVEGAATDAKPRKVNWSKWKARAARGRDLAIAGSEVLSGQRPMDLPRLAAGSSNAGANDVEPAGAFTKMGRGIARGANWGMGQIEEKSSKALVERRLQGLSECEPSDAAYWAVYQGSCGHLIITPQRVLFKSLFSRKPASTDDEDSDSEGEPVIDATTGEALVAPAALEQAKITTLLDARLENLVALKKVRSVGVGTWTTNGLQITVKGKKIHTFNSMVNRDEGFNRLLALAPIAWTMV